MEGLADLLPLLFIGLYYLLSARRKARVRKAAQNRVEAPQTELVPDEAQTSTPFQSFLDQLEQAMQDANGVSVAEDAPAPEADLPTATSEFHAVTGSFDAPDAVDHEVHGFGSDNPLSEERFEKAPAFTQPRSASPRSYDPHGLSRPPVSATARATWRRRLRDPEAARDAFVLQTIFGPRGGIHGDHSKREPTRPRTRRPRPS